jgi:hypothetical protein
MPAWIAADAPVPAPSKTSGWFVVESIAFVSIAIVRRFESVVFCVVGSENEPYTLIRRAPREVYSGMTFVQSGS